jgi:hypothetical protein
MDQQETSVDKKFRFIFDENEEIVRGDCGSFRPRRDGELAKHSPRRGDIGIGNMSPLEFLNNLCLDDMLEEI